MDAITSALNFETPECKVFGRVEPYSCTSTLLFYLSHTGPRRHQPKGTATFFLQQEVTKEQTYYTRHQQRPSAPSLSNDDRCRQVYMLTNTHSNTHFHPLRTLCHRIAAADSTPHLPCTPLPASQTRNPVHATLTESSSFTHVYVILPKLNRQSSRSRQEALQTIGTQIRPNSQLQHPQPPRGRQHPEYHLAFWANGPACL
jgi:hypothetical protein